MRKLIIVLTTVLGIIFILGACTEPTIAPAPEQAAAPASPPEPESTPMPKQAPPKPGEWVASTTFGELRFVVNPSSTGIAQIHLEFKQFECGDVTWESGGVTFENASPSRIIDSKFEFEAYVNPWDFIVEGEFDRTGVYASGTWQVKGKDCHGEWESSKLP